MGAQLLHVIQISCSFVESPSGIKYIQMCVASYGSLVYNQVAGLRANDNVADSGSLLENTLWSKGI